MLAQLQSGGQIENVAKGGGGEEDGSPIPIFVVRALPVSGLRPPGAKPRGRQLPPPAFSLANWLRGRLPHMWLRLRQRQKGEVQT